MKRAKEGSERVPIRLQGLLWQTALCDDPVSFIMVLLLRQLRAIPGGVELP